MKAYLAAFVTSLAMGMALIYLLDIDPMKLFSISTKRLSYVNPIFELGSTMGINLGVLLFLWNATAALITISFLHTGFLFNPNKINEFPKGIR
ncbi:MAG: hypothetical protein GY699_14750, partial [Desulfobacteraceae bacterium]|nr:hypothetical protein [Desulfobacteraceae bacterium]